MKTRATIHWLVGIAGGLLLAVPALFSAGGPIDPPPVNPPSRGEDSRCQFLLEETENLLEECEASNVTFPGDGWPQDAYPSGGVPLSYTDNLDGTFTDDNTGLMWEIKLAEDDPLCEFGEQVYRNVHCVQNRYTWSLIAGYPDGTAFVEFLNELNGSQFAGYDDWRLPTVKELQSLLDCSESWPAVQAPDPDKQITGLPGATKADVAYWSSTSVSDGDIYAWWVRFAWGQTAYYFKDEPLPVRAVRGGW